MTYLFADFLVSLPLGIQKTDTLQFIPLYKAPLLSKARLPIKESPKNIRVEKRRRSWRFSGLLTFLPSSNFAASLTQHFFVSSFASLETRRKLGCVSFREDFWDCHVGEGEKFANSWPARPR